MSFPRGMTSMPWTKGDRKARKELEKALEYDKDDHVTRFALVRLLSNKGEWEVAEDILNGPEVEENLLADPNTHVARVSSLGEAYLALWRARGQYSQHIVNSQEREPNVSGSSDYRLDVSGERRELLHRAQGFLEEALAAPENVNDAVLRAQLAFCKEARGDCSGALSIYAGIIADSPASPGTSAVIFRTSVLLAHVGRFDESARYLEFIEGNLPKGCSQLLLEALLYVCNVALGLELKVSKRLPALRESYHSEFSAGIMGTGFDRDKIPWDRLPGWVCMWQELGEQSLRRGDYYLGVLMLSQALLIEEDAETLTSTGELLWVLGDKKEDRRNAVAEMQRLATRSGRKADAMIARRKRREKFRVFRVWRRLHNKMKHMAHLRQQQDPDDEHARNEEIERHATTNTRTRRSGRHHEDDGQEGSRGGSSTKSSVSSGTSRSEKSYSTTTTTSGSATSSSGLSVSTLSSDSTRVLNEITGRYISAPRWSAPLRSAAVATSAPPLNTTTESQQEHETFRFPTPSAEEAQRAGRVNFNACFRAQKANLLGVEGGGGAGGEHGGRIGDGKSATAGAKNLAPVDVATKMVREAMVGSGGRRRARGLAAVVASARYRTPEMQALARFEFKRRDHEAKNTRAIFGS